MNKKELLRFAKGRPADKDKFRVIIVNTDKGQKPPETSPNQLIILVDNETGLSKQ